ncbi:MAG: DUF4446 family protein [Chloroflexota bacterium]
MSFNELAAWIALGLALVLGVLYIVQALRLGRIERQYRTLMRGTPGAAGLRLSIGELVAGQGERLEVARAELAALQKKVGDMDVLLSHSVQHVGLVRYNPFQETGGDQSFALALLDNRGDGVVISSLHSRTMTRFYAKPIKASASPLSLSAEEVQAVQQAMSS